MSLGEAHQPLRDQVRDVLRDRILSGVLPPGTRITERAVAEDLGVSRIPVRDALNMLKGEGLVTDIPRRGVIVTAMSAKDAEELFDVRTALEVLSVRLATERATAEEVAELREVLEAARTAMEAEDATLVAGCNQALHDKITAIAHNDLLASTLAPLEARLHWLLRQNDDPDELFREHEQLVEAIASGDAAKAEAVSLQHVNTSRRLVFRLLFDADTAAG
jgi:DNA-binding GntR family transcriptional regulator